jgi:hypothetical protein
MNASQRSISLWMRWWNSPPRRQAVAVVERGVPGADEREVDLLGRGPVLVGMRDENVHAIKLSGFPGPVGRARRPAVVVA